MKTQQIYGMQQKTGLIGKLTVVNAYVKKKKDLMNNLTQGISQRTTD